MKIAALKKTPPPTEKERRIEVVARQVCEFAYTSCQCASDRDGRPRCETILMVARRIDLLYEMATSKLLQNEVRRPVSRRKRK